MSSSEPDNAGGNGNGKGGSNGDGNTNGDIAGHELGTADTDFQVRAERSGGGPGRTYTATYAATDASGNSGLGSAEVTVSHSGKVTVPHSQPPPSASPVAPTPTPV